MKHFMTIALLMAISLATTAQVHCFARIALDRSSVYVQQPFKVTITVLTATWYTEPLDFDNIQIPNAFTLPFDQTLPGMHEVGGNQYAGLTFYFIVFPYQAGTFTIPPIHIVATTPPQGSSVAKKVRITTPGRRFTVKPVPDKLKGTNWLVAKNVFIHERWNRSLQHLKVGDVIERTVTIDARGTLPQFIPTLPRESLSFASTYLQDAELDDERNEYDANGRLTQSITYLLEKEGDFEIPAVELNWWNPLNSRQYKKATAPVRIHVAANPHLGMMTTLQDSLAATQATLPAAPKPHKPFTILGIPWYWLTLYSLAALCCLYFLTRWGIRLFKAAKGWYTAYQNSETHWFRQLRYGASTPASLIPHLYAWWDRLYFPGKEPAPAATWRHTQQTALSQSWQVITTAAYNPHSAAGTATGTSLAGKETLQAFKSALAHYRKTIKHQDTTIMGNRTVATTQLPW